MAEFDYLGAKQAGASDEEIQSFLKANGTDFDLIGAKQAGATDDEISTFLKSQPVKKKEVSKPTAQVSSNGTTKTSQSSYNLDLSLPKVNPNNKALPGLGQPFKPEIALKSINDERKFINAKTPTQTNFQDYNTVINDGIKGQNKFDNTTQILTSQNVIPQQAKKEVQQLQQKQQVVKDAKKDTRQNILAVIPELADAKNTDEAISTILKSDMKNNLDYWQQFDDEALLGNDENTLNDFLVSNGLKNQDRELYLKEQASSNPKYGYEYEYNKIGSLFKAVKQRADDYDTVLKQKFGDNYMEIAKQGNSDILNDQDFNKFRQLREKQNELSTKANGLINDSRYSEVKSSREKVEKAQQGVDERAKNDKVYKVGDELNYIGNKLAYGAGHVVKMIAELPSLATSIDKGYDFTDRLADWGDRFSNGLIDAIPVSSDIQAGFNNKVANVDGYKVIVDDNGNAVNVTDSKNFKVPTSVFKAVVDKYNTDKTKYSVNNEYNPRSLADNGLNTVIDMGIMILGTKGVGMVGAGEKLQKLTSMGIAYQQTKRDVFNDAIKKGLDPRNADLLSNIIGVAAGTSSMLNPMEFNIAKGAGLFNLLKTDGLNAAKLALIKEGKLSVKDYAKEFVSGAIKNTGGEWVEELGIENTTQAIANNHFNNQISETDMVDGGLDDRLHILDKQGLETFLITAGSSFLMTPIEINSQTQFNQQEAMKMAIENPEDFAKIKELQLKKGQISQQQFDNETKIYNDVSKTYNAVKDDVKEELQPQLLALLTKKSNLSNKISEIKDEVLSKPYKEQLEQINKGIESISNGKNASESLVAPIEQSEILAESTAKDGSSTITKVETEIANKINKGQELTAEETDYYNAQKDSIDKLVTVNKSPIVPTNETVEVEKKEIVLPPPTPQVVAPAELDEQQITEQLNEVLNDKTTPTPLVNTEQEQNISERLPSEYQNNQGVQQINGIGQDVSNESEVPQIEQEQEVVEPISEEVNKDKSVTEKERQDLVKSLNKEQVKEFIKLKNPQERIKFLSDLKNANNKEESKSDKNNEDEQVLQNNISDVLSTKTEEITPKKSIEVDRNVDRDKIETKELKFTTHTGEEVSGKRLTDTLNKVADDMVESANKKRQEHYADHITEKQKDEILVKDLAYAEGVRKGDNINNFTIQQRINTELTGESVPLFTPDKSQLRDTDVPQLETLKDVGSKPQVGDVVFDSRKGEDVTVLKISKPKKGSALENEPYIIDVKYSDGRKAINMPIGDRFKIKPILKQESKTEVAENVAKKEVESIDKNPNVALNMEFLGKVNGEKIGTALLKKDDGYYYYIGGKEVKIPNQARAEKAFNESKQSEIDVSNNLNEEEIVQQLNITKDEAKSAKSASAKRTRKSKSIVEAIEDETKVVADSRDGKRAKELIESIEIAENAILNNTDTDELFESKHGVSEITLAKTLNAKGRKAKIGEVYEELTGKPLVGSGYYAKDEELEQYNIFIKDFLNAIGREGIKLVSPIDIDEENAMLLESQPQPIKPLKTTGIESLSKIVSGDDLRPALASVFIDGDNYVATDAHKLIIVKRNESDESVIAKMKESILKRFKKVASDKDAKIAVEKEILKLKDGIDGKLLNLKAGEIVDAKFPDYKAVIPENIKKTKPLDIQTIIDITNGAKNVLRNVSGSKKGMVIPFTGYESINIGVNPEYFLDVLQALQANGAKKITLNIDTVSRAIVIKSDNGDLGLTMPIFLGDLSEIKSEYEMTIIKAPELEISVSKNDAKIMRINLQKRLDNKSGYHTKEYEKAVKAKDDYSIRYHKPLMLDEVAELKESIQKLDDIINDDANLQSTAKQFTPISQSKFNQLLDKLKKAFPNVKVELFGKNDFDNARKELEKRGIVVTDTKTKDGTIYGFKTPDGKVFLNYDAINANTPIHEFGHIWQSVFPNEFAKGISLLVQSPQGRELINEIRKNPAYKGKSITEIQAEALVTAIGNKGETIFNSNPTLYNKFKQWLNDLFAKIGDKLGIKNLSPDDKFDMFTKKVVGELLGGKVLDSKVGTEKSTEKTITFQGQNIKVKEINGGAEVVNGFYSPLEKIINETKFEKLPAKQWVDKFAKGEEAKWTGLTDWLGQQQGSVSKTDIQQFLKDNRIEIVEVVKGGEVSEAEIDVLLADETGEGMTRDEAREYLSNDEDNNQTKFSQYQLEGEKGNYKEVLVTMPVVSESAKNVSEKYWEAAKARDEYKKQNAPRKQGEDIVAYIDRANAELNNDAKYQELTKNAEVLNKKMDDANKNQGEKFKSSHFDEANILVHLRMNTRTDADGNKVLFLEEVQSDWGQKGKKEGFIDDQTEANKLRKEFDGKYGKGWGRATLSLEDFNRFEKSNISIDGTPTAPFITDTNAWTKLGLKVALKEAVKQGATKIAWTTGEQQNDRYDLQKQVDFIDVFTNDDGTYHIVAVKGNNTISEEKSLKENQLEGLLGKDLTNKIIEDTKNHTHREGEENLVKTYRGKDLSVGGKGMKGFYGSPTEGSLGIVGNVAKSLFKQEPKTVNIEGKKDLKNEERIKYLQHFVDELPQLEKSVSENKLPFTEQELDNSIEKGSITNESYKQGIKQLKKYEESVAKYNEYKERVDEYNKLKFGTTQHSIDITPEMKAMVELGQPLFQFKPDELTNKVQELRDFDLTDSEIRDYLLEAGNTKQQIDDALGVKEVEENKDEVKKELSDSKQRVAERIVLGNSTLNAVKEHIVQQGYDKSDYDSKQIFKDVDELINKFGIEKAESFIDKIGDVGLSEPHKVVLQHKIAEYYGNKALSDETLTEEERKDAMFKSAQLFLDLSEQRTDAGRGNAILAQIYLESDIYFTLPYFEDKMNAIGAQLSGAEKIELENLQNEIKELRKENTKLQELAKKEAEQQIVDDITTHLLVDDLIIDSKIKDDLEVKNAKSILAKGFEDIARMLSSIAMAQQVDKVKFKDTILDMTKATMTISKIGVKKALKSVIKAIKNANQNIDEKLLEDAEKHVLSQIKDTDTGIKKKNKEGISKDELIELIDQGADTMEKMVEAIRNKYYDGDKSISDKQIRDEITNYGNSIRQSQTQVEEKLSEIKSLMLLQSKLEDAENNIAPKKTGFIRDKDKIAVREKRRELAEAMKKLTVTLSEDDIAGLNERKLTQIANKIEEVQKVLDGYEKIKNKANFDYNDAVKKKQQELDDLMSSQKALLHYAKENLTNLVAKYQDKLDKKQYSKNPTLNKLSITDSEYQKLKNQLEAKKEQLKSERDNFRNNNADYLLENRQKQIDRQIVEIDNLLAGIKVRKTSEQIKAEKDRKAGVINSSTNQTALDKLKENQKVLEAKKEQWERKVIQKEVEIEKAKQTWLQKLGINAMSISRTLTLGFTDIGWLGVQGGYFARTKPHLFAKALKESFKGKLSEEAFNQWKRDLKSNPFYETMIKAGLRIPSQSLRDDIFEQEFRESGFTKLLGKNEATDIVNKNARLSVKFLANLRIQVFQKMYNGLTDSQKADKEVLEKLADYVNSRSGAGQVIGEDNKRGLNKWWGLLTSARNTSAMLQQTYIGMLYGLAKNYVRNKPLSNQPIIARQLVNDLLNQAVLFSGLYLSYLVANGLSGDDDEWNVETSPFSTNFLKLKNKEGDRSYFDMGGMTALNVATLRLLTTITNAFGTDINNLKDYEGKYSKVGLKDYSSKTGLQILSESIFNRTLSLLAPIKNPFTAKSDKDGNYSMYGKTYTPTEFKLKMLMDMFIPMNLPNIYNDITDKDVNALNAIVNTVLNVIGVSNQNQKYDRPEDSTSPQVNSVPVKSTPVSSMPIVPRPVK